MTFTDEGVYDYYCVPHEHAGMVGRIVVGDAEPRSARCGTPEAGLTPLPEVALSGVSVGRGDHCEERGSSQLTPVWWAFGLPRWQEDTSTCRWQSFDNRPILADMSDEQLVALARQGGENAVRALIKRNNQRLFRVARAVVRDDAEAEDIVRKPMCGRSPSSDSFRGQTRSSRPG